jgi:hypothetical protein
MFSFIVPPELRQPLPDKPAGPLLLILKDIYHILSLKMALPILSAGFFQYTPV